MAQARGNKAYVDMSGGIVTEASPLDFPQNASSDELNMLFEKSERKRVKRRGLVSSQPDFTESVIDPDISGGKLSNSFFWQKEGLYVIGLEFTGTGDSRYYIKVHSAQAPYTDFGSFEVATSEAGRRFSFAQARNGLCVVLEGEKPLLLLVSENIVGISEVDLFVRDFKLLDDNLTVTERPPTLEEEHQYNLYNAGWYQERFTTTSDNVREDPVEYFYLNSTSFITATGDFDATDDDFSTTDTSVDVFATLDPGIQTEVSGTANNNMTFTFQGYSEVGGVRTLDFGSNVTDELGVTATFSTPEGYPSNADISYIGLVPNNEGDKLVLDASFLQDQTFGNTPAPRGHYVYNINDFDRNDRLLNKDNDGAVENTLTQIGSIPL